MNVMDDIVQKFFDKNGCFPSEYFMKVLYDKQSEVDALLCIINIIMAESPSPPTVEVNN